MERNAIETFEFDRGLKGAIYFDDDPPNPRTEWDNLGTMVCWHRQYNLGDPPYNEYVDSEQFFRALAQEVDATVEDRIDFWESGQGWASICSLPDACDVCDDRVRALIRKVIGKHYIVLPIYLYEHGGITISAGSFSCPWDSGQVGYIYLSLEKAREEYGWKKITPARRQELIEYLDGEVKAYDRYLTGQIFGFVLEDAEDNHIESCWGFDDQDYCEQQLRSAADWALKKIQNEIAEETAEEVEG